MKSIDRHDKTNRVYVSIKIQQETEYDILIDLIVGIKIQFLHPDFTISFSE